MPRKLLLSLLLFLLPIVAHSQFPNIKLKFEDGQVSARFNSKSGEKEFILDAVIPSTIQGTNIELLSADSVGIVTRKYVRYFEHTCEITSSIKKTAYGLQWDIEIAGKDSDWTAPIETSMQWKDPGSLQFWTTWSDNHLNPKSDQWQDPFLPAPFQHLELVYGGENHLSRDAFVTPIACSFLKDDDLGVSFIQSLNDTILDLEMHTSASGKIAYRHLNHRIGMKHAVHICQQIIFHEADWRASLSWVVQHYKGYFLPEEPLVDSLAGCGAYSSYEGGLDAAKYKKMGFSLNWKASLDFPYMGLFIAPVKNEEEQWRKYKQGGVQIGDGYASISRLNKYAEHLSNIGFHTLNYFNAAEFGNGIVYPYNDQSNQKEALWKNPNDFVYKKLRRAFLKPAGMLPDWDDRPLFSNWEGSIVLDPADSTYHSLLLEQARLQIAKIPASSGICIDRLDWMRYYNSNGDDGISMVQRQKTRAMTVSWKAVIAPIGQLMHAAHKVIFCNPLDRRVDLLAHIDGIYDEFGYLPSSLNLCAQMALFKPIIAWTASKENLMPDPDAYFQRHLYLGAFLTVPYPGNDHCIEPDVWAERYYTDYGLLLMALKGRQWVLSPHVVEVAHDVAKANVFKVKEKIFITVVLAGTVSKATVILRLPYSTLTKETLQVKVLYPGEKKWKTIKTVKFAKTIILDVPIKRGCALLCLG